MEQQKHKIARKSSSCAFSPVAIITALQVISLAPSSLLSNLRVNVPSSFLTIAVGEEPGCRLTPF